MVSVADTEDGCMNPAIHHTGNIWAVASEADHHQVVSMDGNLSIPFYVNSQFQITTRIQCDGQKKFRYLDWAVLSHYQIPIYKRNLLCWRLSNFWPHKMTRFRTQTLLKSITNTKWNSNVSSSMSFSLLIKMKNGKNHIMLHQNPVNFAFSSCLFSEIRKEKTNNVQSRNRYNHISFAHFYFSFAFVFKISWNGQTVCSECCDRTFFLLQFFIRQISSDMLI